MNNLRIEIERSKHAKGKYNIKEGDITGFIFMSNMSMGEILGFIKDSMKELREEKGNE